MQIPILNGVYTDANADFRISYPRNLIPVARENGISKGYLRPADGIVQFAEGPGADRGGINWNGSLYRVMGTKLVKVDSVGTITELGDVGGSGQVTFDYSFDRLAVCSSGNLYYWNGATLAQVTDPDLGTVLDFIWADGYFMTTDGSFLVVTDLNDPTSINALKYGSSELDPDPVKGIIKIRDEPHAINRYTIEVFKNIGGNFFPFQRIDGAQIMRGAVGTHACCSVTLNNSAGVAFLGSTRNEPLSIWFGSNGSTAPLATAEIDKLLKEYSEAELESTLLEMRFDEKHAFLYVHLPDKTLVYDVTGSQVAGEHVWFILDSGLESSQQYKGKNLVWCYDKWISGDPTSSKLGYFVKNTSHHYGEVVGWEFGTLIVYNESRGAIFHELELAGLTGSVELGKNPTLWTSYSLDGKNWSMERPRSAGKIGQTEMRLNWLQCGHMQDKRIQKFRGTSDAHISVARLEARIEPLK